MLKTFLFLAFFFVLQSTFAQKEGKENLSKFLITGKVVDSLTQSPLGFATIVLKETGPSIIPLLSTVSDYDGSFNLEGEFDKKYILDVSYMGFNTASFEFSTYDSKTKRLGSIKLSQTISQLEEIVISAEKPLIIQDLDKLTYNVDMDPDSYFLSAFEILRKIPFISIDGEDNLQVGGNASYQVLINGSPSSLFVQNPSEVFKNMPGNIIKSIEIITNPPARFDADGAGGIINVITHKKLVSGYNGNINSGISSPVGATGGGYLTGKFGKFSLSSTFGTKKNISPPQKNVFFREDGINDTRLHQSGERNSQNSLYYYSTEIGYELGALSILKGSYRINKSQNFNDFFQSVELFEYNGDKIQAYNNVSNGQSKSESSDISLDFQKKFQDNPQRLLTMLFRHSNNSMSGYSDFLNQPILNYLYQNSQTENVSITQDYSFQADYVHPINKHYIEIGLKSNFRGNTNNYYYQNLNPDTGVYLIDSAQSNNFDYLQEIHAAYLSFRSRWENWGLKTGIRVEETKVTANFLNTVTIANQHFINLIPNLSISRALRNGKPVHFSYSQRLERPNMFHINPYVNLIDPLNISFGNPDLNPATNHIINLGYNTYIKEASLSLNLNHQYSNNSIQRFTTLGEDKIARSTYGNIGQRKIYGANLNGNMTLFNKMTISLNSLTSYTQIIRYSREMPLKRSGVAYNLNSSATFRMKNSWRASGNFGYISPQILLQGKSAGFFSNSIAMSKDFLNNKQATFSLNIQNPFQRYRRFLNVFEDPNFYQFQESFSVIREFNLNFNYRFGKVLTRNPNQKLTKTKENN